MWKKWKTYIISVVLALAVGGLAAVFTRNSMNIYETLNTPPLSPPAKLFPIVWTILYILMGISIARVYETGKKNSIDTSSAVRTYIIQLAANFLWSIVFFNLRAYLFSFIWLILLWVMIIIMIVKFYEVSKVAAYIQIPYLLWVTFAAYLNFMIFILNR